MDVDRFFASLWNDFTAIAPAAAGIRHALEAAGQVVVNDHVAFRTFDKGPVALEKLEPHLLGLGYERHAPYRFEDKKLRAYGYVHPRADVPFVFLSELQTGDLSPSLQATVEGLVAQVPAHLASGPEVFWSGRPWAPVPFATYQALLEESEYAGWVAAMGFRANHFTIRLNELSPELRQVASVLAYVESLGFRVLEAGGRVKGSPGDLLEQGSTIADRMPVAFADGTHVVPTCFYEFALRHPMADGRLYPGFVAASADRIFESTNARNAA